MSTRRGHITRIRSRLRAIESRRAVQTLPRGFFQVIESNHDLNKAKRQIEELRVKYPGYKIPHFLVFAAGA